MRSPSGRFVGNKLQLGPAGGDCLDWVGLPNLPNSSACCNFPVPDAQWRGEFLRNDLTVLCDKQIIGVPERDCRRISNGKLMQCLGDLFDTLVKGQNARIIYRSKQPLQLAKAHN